MTSSKVYSRSSWISSRSSGVRRVEYGDLEVWERPRVVIVIEGVMCSVTAVQEKRRLRPPKTTGYHVNWYDLALKRLVVMKRRYPAIAHDYVSFISDLFVDQVSEYLDAIPMPYDTLGYRGFELFCEILKFQPEIQGIYDSDPERLALYGQRGVGVLRGHDF